MKMKSDKERREALRSRVQDNIKNKDKGGFSSKGLLDTSGHDVSFYKEDAFGVVLDKAKTMYECRLDIIPYIIRGDNHPDGMEAGLEDYILDVYRHRNVGPMNLTFLCLYKTYGLPCPICEERQRLLDSGLDWKDPQVSALNPVRRAIYNVIDVNDPDEKIQIFATTHGYFEKLLVKEVELSAEEMQDFPDLKKGKTIKFRATQGTYGKGKYYEYSNFEFLNREPYPKEILEETFPLDEMLIIPTYGEVQRAFLHLPEGEEGAGQEQEQKPEPERRRKWRSGKGTAQTAQEIEETAKEYPPEEEAKPEDEPPPGNEEPTTAGNSDCPHGHVWGVDTDKFPKDCAECEKWSDCDDEKERLVNAKKADPPAASSSSGKGRRRTRGAKKEKEEENIPF